MPCALRIHCAHIALDPVNHDDVARGDQGNLDVGVLSRVFGLDLELIERTVAVRGLRSKPARMYVFRIRLSGLGPRSKFRMMKRHKLK
jgi:hypothetical protein